MYRTRRSVKRCEIGIKPLPAASEERTASANSFPGTTLSSGRRSIPVPIGDQQLSRSRDLMSRPEVVVHFAITTDGKVSTVRLTPSRFTSSADRHRLLEVRARADAIMAGRGTAERDQMTMGLPDKALRKARIARSQ